MSEYRRWEKERRAVARRARRKEDLRLVDTWRGARLLSWTYDNRVVLVVAFTWALAGLGIGVYIATH